LIKVFNPAAMIDGFADWFENNKYFQPTDAINQVLAQPIRIACLPIFFNIEKKTI
jgi:hypothetical protein